MTKKNLKLEQVRKSKGVTQQALANELNLSVTGYWRKENGRRSFNESEIKKICEFLKVKPTHIFFN